MTGLNYVKMPRNVTEYTLMKGVTDFSNLKQFDLYETGYALLTVVSIPRFMDILASKDTKIRNLQDGFVHILEGVFNRYPVFEARIAVDDNNLRWLRIADVYTLALNCTVNKTSNLGNRLTKQLGAAIARNKNGSTGIFLHTVKTITTAKVTIVPALPT